MPCLCPECSTVDVKLASIRGFVERLGFPVIEVSYDPDSGNVCATVVFVPQGCAAYGCH